MNREDLYQGFQGVDDDILERSEQVVSVPMPIRRRLPVALVAALLALLLMGAGVITVIYGDNIQNWFAHYFSTVTGQEMSEGHKSLIDHLSQDIRLSQTVGETTVTVDSVTVGDTVFYLLLRVEGITFKPGHQYNFDKVFVDVSSDLPEGIGTMGGYSLQFQGLDGDGAALMLMEFSTSTGENFMVGTTPWNIHLVLENLIRDPWFDRHKMITEGIWEFDFSIERQPTEPVSLPDTEVRVMNRWTGEEELAMITDIELTSTGIGFRYDFEEGTLAIERNLEVILTNGERILYGGGGDVPTEDGTKLICAYHWMIPVNLSEVEAVRIGDVEIPVR
ncbi:MAG: hypothetical protein IJZ55_01610 [Lachnospiraceae bacterium]|nr:hypothetical protein [Lachnospiraceae bacterium]